MLKSYVTGKLPFRTLLICLCMYAIDITLMKKRCWINQAANPLIFPSYLAASQLLCTRSASQLASHVCCKIQDVKWDKSRWFPLPGGLSPDSTPFHFSNARETKWTSGQQYHE